MENQYRPKIRRHPRRRHGKPSPVVVIIVVLVLVALVVTAVICMLTKPAMLPPGAAKVGTGAVAMATIAPRPKSYGYTL